MALNGDHVSYYVYYCIIFTTAGLYLSIYAPMLYVSEARFTVKICFSVGGIFSDSAGVLPSSWDILLGGKQELSLACALKNIL